jgi:hypothetical protein
VTLQKYLIPTTYKMGSKRIVNACRMYLFDN